MSNTPNQGWGGSWGQPTPQQSAAPVTQPPGNQGWAAPPQNMSPAPAQAPAIPPSSPQGWQGPPAQPGYQTPGGYAPPQNMPPAPAQQYGAPTPASPPAYDHMHAMRVQAGIGSAREADFITMGRYIAHVTTLKYVNNQWFVVEGRLLWSQNAPAPVLRPEADGAMRDRWEPARGAGETFSITRKLDKIGAKDVNQYEGVLLHGLDPRTQEAQIMAAIQGNPTAMALAMANGKAILHPVVAISVFLNKKGSFTVANMRPIPPEILERIKADGGVNDPGMLASLW